MLGEYEWTNHAHIKMRYYGLSEQRVKRVIRAPFRYEEGVLPKAVAAMQPASLRRDKDGKQTWSQEIWVMYKIVAKRQAISNDPASAEASAGRQFLISKQQRKIKIITAWRYPGVSPKRDPIPADIIREVQTLL